MDYLAVVATNQDAAPAARQVTLEVGSTTRLVLDDARRRLLLDGDANRVFCQFSRPCDPPATGAETDDATRILSDSAARAHRNWANPKIDGASRFRHVLVGEGGPLEFRVTVEPGGRRQVAMGLIEGWHAEPGRRPLRLAVEGTDGRDVDLVDEYGANHRGSPASPPALANRPPPAGLRAEHQCGRIGRARHHHRAVRGVTDPTSVREWRARDHRIVFQNNIVLAVAVFLVRGLCVRLSLICICS